MNNPELAAQLPQASPSRREMLEQSLHNDQGYLALGYVGIAIEAIRRMHLPRKRTIAALGLAGAAVLGTIEHYAGFISEEDKITVSAEPAQYQGSFVLEKPKICWGGYQDTYHTKASYAKNIKANLPNAIPLIGGDHTIPTGYSFSVEKTSQVTEVICTTAGTLKGERDADGISTIKLKKGDFTTYVFPTNPLTDVVETGNGITAVPQKQLEAITKGIKSLNVPLIDKVNTSGSDNIETILNGIATFTGYEQSTKSCIGLAYNDLTGEGEPLKTKMAETVAQLLGTTPDKIKFVLPPTIEATDQYEPDYEQLDGITANPDSPIKLEVLTKTPQCVASPDHNQVVMLPAGVEQPIATNNGGGQ